MHEHAEFAVAPPLHALVAIGDGCGWGAFVLGRGGFHPHIELLKGLFAGRACLGAEEAKVEGECFVKLHPKMIAKWGGFGKLIFGATVGCFRFALATVKRASLRSGD